MISICGLPKGFRDSFGLHCCKPRTTCIDAQWLAMPSSPLPPPLPFVGKRCKRSRDARGNLQRENSSRSLPPCPSHLYNFVNEALCCPIKYLSGSIGNPPRKTPDGQWVPRGNFSAGLLQQSGWTSAGSSRPTNTFQQALFQNIYIFLEYINIYISFGGRDIFPLRLPPGARILRLPSHHRLFPE